MESLLFHLRYIKRKYPHQRIGIYKNATIKKFKAQQTIFRQGDIGDSMYIILKGKVAILLTEPDKPDIKKHIAMSEDGECFGEFSMID